MWRPGGRLAHRERGGLMIYELSFASWLATACLAVLAISAGAAFGISFFSSLEHTRIGFWGAQHSIDTTTFRFSCQDQGPWRN